MNLALRAAITMSPASATLAPAPAATPLTAEITGLFKPVSLRINGAQYLSTEAPRSTASLPGVTAHFIEEVHPWDPLGEYSFDEDEEGEDGEEEDGEDGDEEGMGWNGDGYPNEGVYYSDGEGNDDEMGYSPAMRAASFAAYQALLADQEEKQLQAALAESRKEAEALVASKKKAAADGSPPGKGATATDPVEINDDDDA